MSDKRRFGLGLHPDERRDTLPPTSVTVTVDAPSKL
jgi:hypothetical protein